MMQSFFDPRSEAPALRRAAVLLERVREDGGWCDTDVAVLQAGVATLQRAAAAGREVHSSAIGRMEDVLAHVPPPLPSHAGDVYELLRYNAFVETRRLLARLARSSHVADGVRAPGPDFVPHAH